MQMSNLSPFGSGRPSPVIVGALAACAVLSLLFLHAAAQTVAPPAGPEASPEETLEAGDYRLVRRGFYDKDLPRVTFNFRVVNSSNEPFNQLKFSDLGIKFDGRPVRDGVLTKAGSDPVRVVVLIDGSGSMTRGVHGLNKLEAAKAALMPFINSLSEKDTISVFAFDSRPAYPVSDSGSLALAKQRVSSFQLSTASCEEGEPCHWYTNLYGAIDEMLGYAGSRKIQNLIVVSDGMQNTREWKGKSERQFTDDKHEWEGRLGAKARDNRVRVFTIAIGDHTRPRTEEYVDSDTLKRISGGSSEGDHYDEDLSDLRTRAQNSSASYQDLLTEDLKGIFAKARQSIGYDYRLDLNLGDFPHDGREHTLEMVFPTGDASSSFPAVRYPLSWRPNQPRPEIAKPEMFRVPVFLPHPTAVVRPTSIGTIYGATLGVLAVLAVVPVFYLKAQRAAYRRAQERVVASSVLVVQSKSSYVGQTCPNDSSRPIAAGDVVVVCPRCGRAHHLGCWIFANSCCMVRNCPAELTIPASVLKKYGLLPGA